MGVNKLLTLSSYSLAQSLGFIIRTISATSVSYSCRRITHAVLCRAIVSISLWNGQPQVLQSLVTQSFSPGLSAITAKVLVGKWTVPRSWDSVFSSFQSGDAWGLPYLHFPSRCRCKGLCSPAAGTTRSCAPPVSSQSVFWGQCSCVGPESSEQQHRLQKGGVWGPSQLQGCSEDTCCLESVR